MNGEYGLKEDLRIPPSNHFEKLSGKLAFDPDQPAMAIDLPME